MQLGTRIHTLLLLCCSAAMAALQVPEVHFHKQLNDTLLLEPTLLRGSPVQQWRALQWTLDSLAAAVPSQQMLEAQRSAQPYFMYFDEMEGLLEDHAKHRYAVERLQLNMSALVAALKGESGASDAFWYLTEDLSVIAPKLLRDDVKPMPKFQRGDEQEATANKGSGDGEATPMASLWMGSPGVVTQLHYDMPANLFVQLRGTKKFSLFGPELATDLYMYPDLHPRARKSQIDFSLPFERLQEKYPRAVPLLTEAGITNTGQGLRLYTVQMQPGDVLYVPPMWLHHVETLFGSPALSVNVFYPSREQSLIDSINSAPIPFESDWDSDTMQASLVEYICLIVEQCQFGTRKRMTCSQALAELIDTRYAPLGEPHSDQVVSCPSSQLSQRAQEHRQRMTESIARHLAPLFETLAVMRVDQLALFQHLEYLLNYFVGKEALRAFVEKCMIRREAIKLTHERQDHHKSEL